MVIADSEENCKISLKQLRNNPKRKQRTSTKCKEDSAHGHLKIDIPVGNTLWKGDRMKQVGTIKSLGFTITPEARCETETKTRIALSEGTFTKMKPIFTIRIYTKINTLKVYIWSILLHGCECWTLAKRLFLYATNILS